MQPLDYLFLLVILMWLAYGAFSFWKRFLRVNLNTSLDGKDLFLRYCCLLKVKNERAQTKR